MEMSTEVDEGTSLSLDGGALFQTFRDLLQQREELDKHIKKVQGRLFRIVEKGAKKATLLDTKKYVARMQNHTILAEAIRECMIPGKKMGMKEILSSLQNTGSYKTQSSYFYTMVNNKLNRDPRVKKVSRGVFVYKPLPAKASGRKGIEASRRKKVVSKVVA
jgi:hypothetical protein